MLACYSLLYERANAPGRVFRAYTSAYQTRTCQSAVLQASLSCQTLQLQLEPARIMFGVIAPCQKQANGRAGILTKSNPGEREGLIGPQSLPDRRNAVDQSVNARGPYCHAIRPELANMQGADVVAHSRRTHSSPVTQTHRFWPPFLAALLSIDTKSVSCFMASTRHAATP